MTLSTALRTATVAASVLGFAGTTTAQCQVAKLLADDGAADGWFGTAVAVDGDTALLGAGARFDTTTEPGMTHIFVRGGGDVWTPLTTLSGDAVGGDNFGFAVAIDGDTAVVGAYADTGNAEQSGVVYVFERDAGGTDNWGRVARLIAPDAEPFDWFGFSVAIDGDTLVVGAPFSDPIDDREGSVYVFERDLGGADNWGSRPRIVGSDAAPIDQIGYAVAIQGDTILAGAIGASHCAGDPSCDAGSVYVLERDLGGADNWGERQILSPDDGAASDVFGISVDLDGDTAIVGAIWSDTFGSDVGSASIYERTGNTWNLVVRRGPQSPEPLDSFGYSVSIEGDDAMVGRSFQFVDDCTDPGSVHHFRRDTGGPGAWGLQAEIIAADRNENDQFGQALALSGTTLFVGAVGDDDLGLDSGSAYAFTLAGTDCNANGVCDDLDIADGTSDDVNTNNVPDECEDLCRSDLDDNGVVDFGDVLVILSDWGPCP